MGKETLGCRETHVKVDTVENVHEFPETDEDSTVPSTVGPWWDYDKTEITDYFVVYKTPEHLLTTYSFIDYDIYIKSQGKILIQRELNYTYYNIIISIILYYYIEKRSQT